MNLNLPWWAFALLSAFFAALTTIFGKLGVNQTSSNLATAIRTIIILAVAWGIVYFKGELGEITTINRTTWIFLILSGLGTALSWLAYFRALQLGDASRVAPIDKSSLVMILLLSIIVLHEPLTWQTAVGTACVVAGTLFLIL